MKLAGVQVWAIPAISTTKLRRTSRPRGVWTTSGMELDAVQVALGCGQARVRRRVGLGGRAEAVRQPGDRITVAHPDRLLALETDEQPVLRGDRDVGRAVLAMVGGHDVAAQLAGHQLRAVADAQDGDPPGPDGRVGPRRIGVVDRVPAAGQDDRPGAASLDLLVRRVVRQELRVDVELADAAGDQLGELAAEVEDDDRAGFGGRGAGRPVVARAIRGRGLERGLEVRLDLGIVGGEDPMPGVGRFAVDGLAPPGRRRGVRAGLLLGPVRPRSGGAGASPLAASSSVVSVASANRSSTRRVLTDSLPGQRVGRPVAGGGRSATAQGRLRIASAAIAK